MNFNYEKLEENLCKEVEVYAKSLLDKKDDVYIISLEYFPDFTTFLAIRANTNSYLEEQVDEEDEYTYYKYCEEEWDWDIFGEFKEISLELQNYYKEMEDTCDEDEFDDLQEEHAEKIIEICKNVMKKFKETDTFKMFPKLYLNVYVREYFSEEECIQIFGELNVEDSVEEYSDWLI